MINGNAISTAVPHPAGEAAVPASRAGPADLARQLLDYCEAAGDSPALAARQAVSQLLQAYLDQPDGRLDLARLDGDALLAVPEPVQAALQAAGITDLTLPPGLTQLPGWVIDLANLVRLTLPDYRQAALSCCRPGLQELEVGGDQISEVHVRQGTRVTCPTAAPGKATLHVHDADGQLIATETAPGRIYAASDDQRNFNGRATFPAGTPIVCRHLALQELLDRRDATAGGTEGAVRARRSEARAAQMGSLELLAQHVAPEVGAKFSQIATLARQRYLVGHSRWGEFLASQFAQMPPGATRSLLLHSTNHVLAVELRVKAAADGAPRYGLTFFDPNRTLTHKRVVEQDLARVSAWQLQDFVEAATMQRYFGDEKRETGVVEQLSCLLEVPERLDFEAMSDDALNQMLAERQVERFLGPAEAIDPAQFFHLFYWSMPITDLATQLDACRDPASRKALLAAKSADGSPGFGIALEYGDTDAIKTFGGLVLRELAAERLTLPEATELLAATEPDTTPGLHLAFAKGRTAAIVAFGEVLLQACDLLLPTQIMSLLEATRERDGTPGLARACREGHAQTVAAFGDLVLAAHAQDVLSDGQTLRLLAAKLKDGTPGLYGALQTGQTETIKAFLEIVQNCRLAPASRKSLLETLDGAIHQKWLSLSRPLPEYRLIKPLHPEACAAYKEVLQALAKP